jgi:hypothetical protein
MHWASELQSILFLGLPEALIQESKPPNVWSVSVSHPKLLEPRVSKPALKDDIHIIN